MIRRGVNDTPFVVGDAASCICIGASPVSHAHDVIIIVLIEYSDQHQ